MRFLFLLPILLLAGCFFGGSGPVPPTPVILRDDRALSSEAVGLPPLELHQSQELRRLRDEHEALIASIPPTLEPTPTLTPAERSKVAVARVRHHPDGVPVPPVAGEDWFDPALGIDFYRDNGGDWTSRRAREGHTHRDLFYYEEYPASIPNFHAKTIYRHLAREMVFEAIASLPLLGDPTPAMVLLFSHDLGWELRNSPEPVINLWTTFQVRRNNVLHVYAVGGVMRMGVSSLGEEDDLVEYVTPGPWLGSVVVERLR